MRALVQRVSKASVSIEGQLVATIKNGLVVLIGVGKGDSELDAQYLADKIANLRIFSDEADKFNLSALDIGGEMLVVSQFTLLADTRKGRRPSFSDAARPETAIPLYERFVATARAEGVRVATGEFGAHMQVALVNDGPVTIILDSRQR